MAWNFTWLFQDTATTIVEASLAGTQNVRGNQRGGSTRGMDNTGSGKVNDSNTTIGILCKGAQHAIGTPNGVDHNRVHKAA